MNRAARSLKKLEKLMKVVHELRERCPWDRKQTHKTLIPYLLEEAHETIHAIERKNRQHLKEELGDLLLQIFLHSEIASEKGDFDIGEVAETIADKMIRRHPHVYEKAKYKDYKTHLKNWTKLKSEEKPKRFLLEGIPQSLPALHLSQRYGEIASSVGFDWTSVAQVLEKVEEEMAELRREIARRKANKAAVEMELGDILFTLSNLARHLEVDAERALRKSALKFAGRFVDVEKKMRTKGKTLAQCSLEELESAWQTVK